MNITHTEKILFNPLFTSNLLLMALSGSNCKKIKLELIYMILPLIYNDIIRNKLSKCNVRSSLQTFLTTDIKIELINIEDLITNYRSKSKEALITLSNLYNIEISDFITLKDSEIFTYSNINDPVLKEYYKAAFHLGLIISKEDYKNLFFNL